MNDSPSKTSSPKSKVILRSVEDSSVKAMVREVAEACDFEAVVQKDARVVIKVNLSTPDPEMAHASNTSKELLEEVILLLKERTDRIVVGESDGMRYPTEEAFEVSGYYPILERHGVQAMNFTKDERVEVAALGIKGQTLSRTLVEADVFVSLPVLKTHATTVFTGTLKNQFGCYPQHDRILLHPRLDKVIVKINEVLKPRLVIMDAITAMEGRGPINGEPRVMNVILGSRDPVALDATAMRLIGLDPYTCKHAVLASEVGLGHMDANLIQIDGEFDKLKTVFKPAERDLPIKVLGLISHSRFLVEKLILNPESFYPLRSAAFAFRNMRDMLLGKRRAKNIPR